MSDPDPNVRPKLCHYFVDEAGDPALFNARGKIIIGQEGCSRYFMMGLLFVPDPRAFATRLETLRACYALLRSGAVNWGNEQKTVPQ